MNIDEDGEKNDSRKILPKINCNKKLNETVNKFRIKIYYILTNQNNYKKVTNE